MAKFFIVDQSLCQVGGHHYDYLRLMSAAARSLHFTPIVAANQAFPRSSPLDQDTSVHRLFRRSTYSRYSLLAGLEEISRGDHSFWESLSTRKRSWVERQLQRQRHRRMIRQRSGHVRLFAQDCDRLFNQNGFSEGDHVFFCTLSELDFMGLAAYLASHPCSMQVHWHVQFHFGLFAGRPTEFESQRVRLRTITECFRTALDRIPYHQVSFYTTSDELAEQYNQMELAEFTSLPYPVDPRLSQRSQLKVPKQPLSMTCAGGIRREKQQGSYLVKLIDQVWEELLASGKLEINVQCTNRRWMRRGRHGPPAQRCKDSRFLDFVHVHKHPLDEEDYLSLIEQSDIGLMLYDSRRYYCRRAGVMSEFLAAGTPVIVPAGCWLSKQIAEPTFRHVESVIQSAADVRTIQLDETDWDYSNVPLTGGIVACDQDKTPFLTRFDVGVGESAVCLQFDWHWPAEIEGFCFIDLDCQDSNGMSLSQHSQIVGQRSRGRSPMALFNVPRGSQKIQLRLANAYDSRTVSLKNIKFKLLKLRAPGPVPLGAVGTAVAGTDFLVPAINEILTHYPHYLASAVAFAESWADRHHPRRTLDHLLSKMHPMSRAA